MSTYHRQTLNKQAAYNQLMTNIYISAIISAIVIYVASAIGLMKVFKKAGEKSWKA